MPRLPYAAQTLIDQVTAERKSAKVTPGDPDGLDVYRTVEFDKATSKWLAPILQEIDDERIIGAGISHDVLTVVFTHRTVADDRAEFPLTDAETVADTRG